MIRNLKINFMTIVPVCNCFMVGFNCDSKIQNNANLFQFDESEFIFYIKIDNFFRIGLNSVEVLYPDANSAQWQMSENIPSISGKIRAVAL